MGNLILGDKTVGSKFKLIKQEGLDVGICGGALNRQNKTKDVATKELTLVPNETNYVFIDWELQEIISNITGFPVRAFHLYKMETNATTIIGLEDFRAIVRQAAHSDWFTLPDYFYNQDHNANKDWTLFDVSSLVPVGTTLIQLRFLVRDSGVPGTEVYFGARKPGETAYSQWIKAIPLVSGEWNFVHAPVGLDVDRKFEYCVKVSGTFSSKLALLGVAYGG